jgi:hypothetical protein
MTPAHEVVATAVSLGTPALPALYHGSLTALHVAGQEWRVEARLASSASAGNRFATDQRWLLIRLALRASGDGQVSGLVEGMPEPVATAAGR